MWFKNLYLYRLQEGFECDTASLTEQLAGLRFKPCGGEQRDSFGWVSPFGRDAEQLFHMVNGYILLTMAHQERLLPSTVIKEELDERVQQQEEKEQRKLSSREKKDLREQIEFELLPRAFTRTRKLDAWLDPQGGWLVVNTASVSQAERLTTLLRKTLGSLPVNTLDAGNKAMLCMTQWLKEGKAPAPFELGDECELRTASDGGGVALFKKHELVAEEVMSNLNAGKTVSKMMITWSDKISLVLTHDLQIKRLKFLDIYDDQLNEHDPESFAERLDIEFTLMTGEVTQLLLNLLTCLELNLPKKTQKS